MKKAEAFQMIRERVIQLMETEGSNWTKSWIGNGVPTNFLSKKAYRGMNHFWLAMQGFSSNEWGTFKQWSGKGYKIKKGSKSSFVVFCEVKPKKKEWLEGTELETFNATGVLPKYFLWKVYNVFNADQIEGYESTNVVKNPTKELTVEEVMSIDSFINQTGAKITEHDQPHYRPSTDTIGMPHIKAFFSDVDYYSTLLHELTHWTGHKTRCDRLKGSMFGSEEYAKEELVAEIGSAFLCQLQGVEKTVRADHAQYLNNWIEIISESDNALSSAFSQAQKAVDYLDSLVKEKEEAA